MTEVSPSSAFVIVLYTTLALLGACSRLLNFMFFSLIFSMYFILYAVFSVQKGVGKTLF